MAWLLLFVSLWLHVASGFGVIISLGAKLSIFLCWIDIFFLGSFFLSGLPASMFCDWVMGFQASLGLKYWLCALFLIWSGFLWGSRSRPGFWWSRRLFGWFSVSWPCLWGSKFWHILWWGTMHPPELWARWWWQVERQLELGWASVGGVGGTLIWDSGCLSGLWENCRFLPEVLDQR